MRAKIGARTPKAAPLGGRLSASRVLRMSVLCTRFAGFNEMTGVIVNGHVRNCL
jgi:hypothetical protein